MSQLLRADKAMCGERKQEAGHRTANTLTGGRPIIERSVENQKEIGALTEKELHRLRRQDLLKLLLSQSKEVIRQKEELDSWAETAAQRDETIERLKKKLDEKEETIEQLIHRLNGKDIIIEKLTDSLNKKDAAIEKLKGYMIEKVIPVNEFWKL